jgi:hypothetical protein
VWLALRAVREIVNFWIPPNVYCKREEVIMLKIFIFTCEQQFMCLTSVHPGSSFSKKRNSYCESCVVLPQGPGANRKCKTFSRRSEGWNKISTMHLKCLIELSLTGECIFFLIKTLLWKWWLKTHHLYGLQAAASWREAVVTSTTAW